MRPPWKRDVAARGELHVAAVLSEVRRLQGCTAVAVFMSESERPDALDLVPCLPAAVDEAFRKPVDDEHGLPVDDVAMLLAHGVKTYSLSQLLELGTVRIGRRLFSPLDRLRRSPMSLLLNPSLEYVRAVGPHRSSARTVCGSALARVNGFAAYLPLSFANGLHVSPTLEGERRLLPFVWLG